MSENSKNIIIGSVVVISLAILSWILLFLHPSFGDEKFQFHARFPAIDKVSVGTRVTYAGKPVGKVIDVTLLPQESRKAGNPDDPIYIYDLLLGIDSSITVYDCDTVDIGTSGLMGERFVSILPKWPAKGKLAKPLVEDETVFAQIPVNTEEALTKLAKTVSNLEQITSNLTGSEGLNNLLASVTTMCHTINETSLVFQALIEKASSDQSSIGQILTNDDFYQKTTAILNKADILMNDINTYGPLFHLNKAWQRESKKRTEQNQN